MDINIRQPYSAVENATWIQNSIHTTLIAAWLIAIDLKPAKCSNKKADLFPFTRRNALVNV